MADAVNPDYYENGPFECILLAEQYSFNVGNMIKYVWRHKDKGHPKEDLQKALWYAQRAKANGESFAAYPWHSDSDLTDYIRSPLRLGDSDSPESRYDYRRGT